MAHKFIVKVAKAAVPGRPEICLDKAYGANVGIAQ